MRTRGIVAALLTAALFTGCGWVRMAGTYSVKTDVNRAAYYRNRYLDWCAPTPLPGVPCEEWRAEQEKLDKAQAEAVDALAVGGSEKLQLAALRHQIDVVKKKFELWAPSKWAPVK